MARDRIALGVLVVSALTLAVLAVVVVLQDSTNAMLVFNVLLPVVASWVGTVLAFYFGRENFEAASKQIRETLIAAGDKTRQLVTSIMRPFTQTEHFTIPNQKKDVDVLLSELIAKRLQTGRGAARDSARAAYVRLVNVDRKQREN
jgi:hypothetical protein